MFLKKHKVILQPHLSFWWGVTKCQSELNSHDPHNTSILERVVNK